MLGCRLCSGPRWRAIPRATVVATLASSAYGASHLRGGIGPLAPPRRTGGQPRLATPPFSRRALRVLAVLGLGTVARRYAAGWGASPPAQRTPAGAGSGRRRSSSPTAAAIGDDSLADAAAAAAPPARPVSLRSTYRPRERMLCMRSPLRGSPAAAAPQPRAGAESKSKSEAGAATESRANAEAGAIKAFRRLQEFSAATRASHSGFAWPGKSTGPHPRPCGRAAKLSRGLYEERVGRRRPRIGRSCIIAVPPADWPQAKGGQGWPQGSRMRPPAAERQGVGLWTSVALAIIAASGVVVRGAELRRAVLRPCASPRCRRWRRNL